MQTPTSDNIRNIETAVREGLKKYVEEIVTDEATKATERVAERVNALKDGAIRNILTRFQMNTREDFGKMQLVVTFNL